ncbi:DinB family protein [Streptomyces albus]|uniref:DinB family protein n=1 Tax=Streptomyces albus TaxID=1888 RepID=UPI0004CBDB30|nr:DinB family protein [Streptomyces albus]
MTTFDRPIPPLTADERTGLEVWLDFQRETLAGKCRDLTDEQLREAAVPPSGLTLLGLVRHITEVERNWSRRVLLGENAPPVFGGAVEPGRMDGGFDLSDGLGRDEVFARWRAEIDSSRKIFAAHGLDDTGFLPPNPGPVEGPVNLRWIHIHLIGEYARHNGHADLIRERIDGVTGV